jgi:hypothetical protein
MKLVAKSENEDGQSDTRNVIRTGEITPDYEYRIAKTTRSLAALCAFVIFVTAWQLYGFGVLASAGIAFVSFWVSWIVFAMGFAFLLRLLSRRAKSGTGQRLT